MTAIVQANHSTSTLFVMFADLYRKPDKGLWMEVSQGYFIKLLMDLSKEIIDSNTTVEITRIPTSFEEMKMNYIHILEDDGRKTSLSIESLHKAWTNDPSCAMPFSKSKGYLLGDSAMHIRYLLNQFDIQIPEEYINTPDHLTILLELLSFFIEFAPMDFTLQFIEDHFDWLDEFADILEHKAKGNFYLQITRLLQQVLNSCNDVLLIKEGM